MISSKADPTYTFKKMQKMHGLSAIILGQLRLYQICEFIDGQRVAVIGAVVLQNLLVVIVPDEAARTLLLLVAVRLTVKGLPRVPFLIETCAERDGEQSE